MWVSPRAAFPTRAVARRFDFLEDFQGQRWRRGPWRVLVFVQVFRLRPIRRRAFLMLGASWRISCHVSGPQRLSMGGRVVPSLPPFSPYRAACEKDAGAIIFRPRFCGSSRRSGPWPSLYPCSCSIADARYYPITIAALRQCTLLGRLFQVIQINSPSKD
jgi:hypothetical protein